MTGDRPTTPGWHCHRCRSTSCRQRADSDTDHVGRVEYRPLLLTQPSSVSWLWSHTHWCPSQRPQEVMRVDGSANPTMPKGLLHEYIGHDVSNMRGFDSYRLLTLSLAALMTRISSVVIEGAHTSAGAATLARTVPFWGRFRSPREPTAEPCRGCLLPSATNTAPSRHHLQAVLCDGWDVQTPPSWLLRPQTRELYGWS